MSKYPNVLVIITLTTINNFFKNHCYMVWEENLPYSNLYAPLEASFALETAYFTVDLVI